MNLQKFMTVLGLQKPLIAIQEDIFKTVADHIAFAVHWPNSGGYWDNDNGGFSSMVAGFGWEDIGQIKFEKGKPVSKLIRGKWFHALPVHTCEENGWGESPELIRKCLDELTVPSTDVIACVLMGGGNAGHKYNASINNIEGMLKSYKTTVLYVHEEWMIKLLHAYGIVVEGLPTDVPLAQLPKVLKYRDFSDQQLRSELLLES